MIKIFITIPWFTPAFKAGGPIQSVANLVKEFNVDANYYIFCSNTDLNETVLEKIDTGKWIPYNANTQVWYAGTENRSKTLVELTEKLRPDVIYIIGIFSWHFTLVPLLFCKAPKKIVSVRGMLHPGALTQKRIKKKTFLFLWKFFDLHKKATFHATDESEKKYIEQNFDDETTIVIAANFPRSFLPVTTLKTAGSLKLISIGIISPMKNYSLVIRSLKLVRTNVEYFICGPIKDDQYWQQCLQEITMLPGNISVKYLGDAPPDKIEEILTKGEVFILPSKSENFGHAFYEALSAGKPVITSHHTPWQKLAESQAGFNLELDEMAIANAVHHYAGMTQEEYDSASMQAVKYANSKINLENIKDQYRNMFHG